MKNAAFFILFSAIAGSCSTNSDPVNRPYIISQSQPQESGEKPQEVN